ncbi:ABC transporter substrate-binding protein [Candidatus Viridilinea mediisalina]|uniref:ABC transporter substrate-binding protein n=1 Tax=Candidatus Viridilinea mediisalina TaxID=2024553 RepID=A0A2A6RPB8_9CHLR|nr:ABC transporter substrate-binding protein [Candidatus Viridilinea mediisalina]PDW04718.1 ABC transporter substrate-binding protein [Candidatus Viridilinea mediisalina]
MTQQMLTRRQMLKLLLASGSTAALAACGAATTTQTPTSPPANDEAETGAPAVVSEPGSTVNITYWGSFSGNLGEAEQAMVSSFNAAQSDVVVDYQFQGNYEETAQKFTAGLQANTIPDVILLSDVWWFSFYVAGMISQLDSLAQAEGVDFSDYEPALLNEGVRQGKHFWIPFARSTPLFYYNKEIWAEVGLPDRAPETWAEFEEWAPQLIEREGTTMRRAAYVHPNGASYIAWLFQPVVWQHGGQYSTDDFTMTMTDSDTLRAAQFFQDSARSNGWATLVPDINTDFIGGTAASMMASTGSLAGLTSNAPFDVGVGFLPKETNFGCCTGGAGLAIPSGAPAEKQQAAMKFIAFVTNVEQAGVWARNTGYMPVRISTKATPDMVNFFNENPNFKTAVDQLPLTQAQDAARVFVRNGDQIIGKGLERIIINGEDPSTVFTDVNAELTRVAEPILEDLREVEG